MNQLLLIARVEVDGMHLPYVPALGWDINMCRMTQHCYIYHFPRGWGEKTVVGREKNKHGAYEIGFYPPTHPPHSLKA